jgi:hypothetical protein
MRGDEMAAAVASLPSHRRRQNSGEGLGPRIFRGSPHITHNGTPDSREVVYSMVRSYISRGRRFTMDSPTSTFTAMPPLATSSHRGVFRPPELPWLFHRGAEHPSCFALRGGCSISQIVSPRLGHNSPQIQSNTNRLINPLG